MGARSIALTADGRALLGLLNREQQSGARLRERSGLNRERFDIAANALWRAVLLQGVPGEGCCQDPCGINCVSASEPERTWRLTEFGNAALTGAGK